jgi:hypothetical protein
MLLQSLSGRDLQKGLRADCLKFDWCKRFEWLLHLSRILTKIEAYEQLHKVTTGALLAISRTLCLQALLYLNKLCKFADK